MLKPDPRAKQYYETGVWSKVAVDGLLRKSLQLHPDDIALIDPADRQNWVQGAPTQWTWAQINTEVDRLAYVIAQWKLLPESSVLVQLPNIAEAVITYFALLRANCVPVIVDCIAGRRELVHAAELSSACAIITHVEVAGMELANQARDAALECASICYIAAFGEGCPDGVISLSHAMRIMPPTTLRSLFTANDEQAAHCVCAVVDGAQTAIWRCHNHVLAAGMMVYLESRAQSREHIIACLPILATAGLISAIVPWMLCQGSLQLLQPVHTAAFQNAVSDELLEMGSIRLVAPATHIQPMLSLLPEAHAQAMHISAVWGAAAYYVEASLQDVPTYHNVPSITDVICFNDVATLAIQRRDGQIQPLLLGDHRAPHQLASTPVFLTLRVNEADQLICEGAVVAQSNHLNAGNTHEISTSAGFFAQWVEDILLTLTPTGRVAAIGGLRVAVHELEDAFVDHPIIETVNVQIVPDELFGQRIRLLASARSRAIKPELLLTLVEKHLHDCGFSPYKCAAEIVMMPTKVGIANGVLLNENQQAG